jgi:negative regulator of flagellin synthesis FlgM
MVIDVRNVGSGKISTNSTKSKKLKDNAISNADDSGDTAADSVELTGKASQIQSLIKQMMSSPVVDNSRVEPVKEKVDQGRYEIEPERVANKMLDFEVGYSKVR